MSEQDASMGREVQAAAEAVLIEANKWNELAPSKSSGEPVGLAKLLDVPVRVTVEVGNARLTLGELVALGPGSLVLLDREAHEPADILVNGKTVARGEVMTVDGRYGVRVTTLERAN